MSTLNTGNCLLRLLPMQKMMTRKLTTTGRNWSVTIWLLRSQLFKISGSKSPISFDDLESTRIMRYLEPQHWVDQNHFFNLFLSLFYHLVYHLFYHFFIFGFQGIILLSLFYHLIYLFLSFLYRFCIVFSTCFHHLMFFRLMNHHLIFVWLFVISLSFDF